MEGMSTKTKVILIVELIIKLVLFILLIVVIVKLLNEPYAPLWYIPDTRRTRALQRYRTLRRWDYPYYKKILDNDPSLFFYDMGHYPF